MSLNRKHTTTDPATDSIRDAALDAAMSAAATTTPIARLLIEQGRSAVYVEDGAMVYVPPTCNTSPQRPDEP